MRIKKRYALEALFVVMIIAFAVWFGPMANNSDLFKEIAEQYGYVGTFLVSIISGFNLIVPVPAIAFLPALVEVGLNKWLLILIISTGMTIADSIAYFVGRIGRRITEKKTRKKMEKLEKLYEKRRWLPLTVLSLYVCLAPLPNEIIIIPLSFLGFKLKTIFPIVFLGNIFFNTMATL